MNRPKSKVVLNENIALEDPHLLEMVVSSGVAYHHAGLSASDRELIESLFRNNKISVLCSTSTLAIGVNLPAHLVIIKSTLQYTESGYSEYSDLDIRQMMGRAGRAGFDTNGVAVILTSTDTEHLYKSISEGKVEIESKLIQSFNEFLSVEVTNGKITSLDQALKWFSYTFLYVRMRLNPKRFSLKTTEPFDKQIKSKYQNMGYLFNKLASIDLYLNELAQSGIIEYDRSDIRITKLGHAMARNFIKFKSVKDLSKSTLKNVVEISDLLRVICQCTEAVNEIRSGDKTLLHKIASDPRLAFPIAGKSNYWESWKKHFLLIQISLQSELVEFEEKLTPIQRSDQHSILESSIRVVKCKE
jgi:ATP-dependent DNA helicase HFM1/MER3